MPDPAAVKQIAETAINHWVAFGLGALIFGGGAWALAYLIFKSRLDTATHTTGSIKDIYENRLAGMNERLEAVQEQVRLSQRGSEQIEGDTGALQQATAGAAPLPPAVQTLIVNIQQHAAEVREANTVASSTLDNLSDDWTNWVRQVEVAQTKVPKKK